MLRVSPWSWLLWAAWILLLPLKWLVCAVCAAAVHELFHLGAVFLAGGRLEAVEIGPVGAKIEASGVEGVRALLCILAGPAGSFAMLFFLRCVPALGVCGLIQGIFNLLPLPSLDGGRALACLWNLVTGAKEDRMGKRP